MAASKGTIGYGTVITIDSAVIGQVMDVSAPEVSVDTYETTNMDSDDGFKEFGAGLADGGEISFDVLFDEDNTTGQGVLLTKLAARAVVPIVVTLPTATGAVWNASAIITSVGMEIPVQEGITRTVGLKITGKPTLTIT
jgi:hypothetical protein